MTNIYDEAVKLVSAHPVAATAVTFVGTTIVNQVVNIVGGKILDNWKGAGNIVVEKLSGSWKYNSHMLFDAKTGKTVVGQNPHITYALKLRVFNNSAYAKTVAVESVNIFKKKSRQPGKPLYASADPHFGIDGKKNVIVPPRDHIDVDVNGLADLVRFTIVNSFTVCTAIRVVLRVGRKKRIRCWHVEQLSQQSNSNSAASINGVFEREDGKKSANEEGTESKA